MPNVEIHGYGDHTIGLRKSEIAKEKLVAAIIEAELGDGLVMTITHDETWDLHGNPSPFLRLYTTRNGMKEENQLNGLLILFQHKGYDVEIIELDGFRHRKERTVAA